jgi:hypothetical protein
VPGEDFAKSTDGEHSRLVVVASDGELSRTRTGNNLIARLGPPSRPARYSLRQPKTWLALTPCARATRATDAPLLLDCPVLSLDCGPDLNLRCEDFCDLRGSVHLRSKWTHKWCPQRARMPFDYCSVQTVTAGRLPFACSERLCFSSSCVNRCVSSALTNVCNADSQSRIDDFQFVPKSGKFRARVESLRRGRSGRQCKQ